MAHRQGHLSDETIERIADRVADRLRLAVYAGDDALLTAAEAAEMLKRAPGTLETWRRIGIGPQVVRLGGRGVAYTVGAIREYIEACRCGGSPRSVRQFLNASTRESADRM